MDASRAESLQSGFRAGRNDFMFQRSICNLHMNHSAEPRGPGNAAGRDKALRRDLSLVGERPRPVCQHVEELHEDEPPEEG